MDAILFLIGVQELGQGFRPFSKEEKQDLMHIAICKVLSFSGFYELEGVDEDGWPHWKMMKKLPHFDSTDCTLKFMFSTLMNYVITFTLPRLLTNYTNYIKNRNAYARLWFCKRLNYPRAVSTEIIMSISCRW